ncbi:hypothetical protein [Vitiosangium sp. GDMCC 1.1324]|uniref:hypothetical protein n=1 Tax=Vitiosangium sp. (strain GDMCC 1.1324) TaxID=2138576 RepID=UPI000D3D03F0|nr:hypothetical protein [Vitiosangium sp. GDMCC 1.1324]PTL80609.1 hypothetical protein DAT35_28695 [Vitiosangium sp. GDMCC 1.1324]
MDPISRRPLAVRTPTASAPQAAPSAPTTAQTVNTAQTVGHTQKSGFEAPGVKAAAPAPIATWRAPADSELGRALSGMLEKLKQCSITIKGDTPESLFRRAILDNKHVTNEQLLAMSKVTLEQLDSGPETRQKVLEKIPNARELPVHKFTVAMMSAVTGIDPQKLSEACPDLGMTGAPNTPLLYAAKTERMQRSTALHDFTDYFRGAGIQGLNKAVWGVENRVLSAIVSALGGGRY